MKGVIKIFGFIINVLLISSITGCADFPDDYAVDASIGEIKQKDNAILSKDGKSYTSAILVNFDIRENSFNKIGSAIVTIDGTEYEIKDQIDPTKGGTAEIPCTLECNKTTSVKAELKIADHRFESQITLAARDFTNHVKCTTGKAEQITPCSAVLYVDVNYPWLIKTTNYYMLINKEAFNLTLNSRIDTFKGKVIRCSVDNTKMICGVSGLDANTTYYYQMVQLDSDSKVILSGETKSFSTIEATAKITTSITGTKLTSATGSVWLDPGNLSGLYTTYDKNKEKGGLMVWYYAKTLEELNSATGQYPGSGTSNITSPYTFSGLDASTKYYYRCDFYIGSGLMCSSGIQEFTTTESTASLNITECKVFDTKAKVGITLDKGNTTGVISSSGTNYATVRIFCGTSKDNLVEQETIAAYYNNTFNFSLNNLNPNQKYYYVARYYAGKCLLGSSEIKEFITYKSSDHIGSLDVSTTTSHSSSSKIFKVTAQKGSVLAFNYSISQGSNSLDAKLSGPINETILHAASTRDDWSTGSVYYVFKETGTYTLTFSYSTGYYAHISINEILLMY